MEFFIFCFVILNVSFNVLVGSILVIVDIVCSNFWFFFFNGDIYFKLLICYGVFVLGFVSLYYVSWMDLEVLYVVYDFSNNVLLGLVFVLLVGSVLMKK